MKNYSIGFILLLASCSHFNQAPKTVALPYADGLVEEIQREADRNPSSFEMDDLGEKSPRRVYFSALYHQYLTLAQHIGKKSSINSCPQFHHDKIETDSHILPKVSFYQISSIEEEGKDYFPELAFNKKFSLKDYYGGIKEEIETLCEEGVSDNYYKFDNLVTHYANKKSFHLSPQAMASVLKIPVFANLYLVKMLQAQSGIVFLQEEEMRIIRMTKTHWFERYLSEAHRKRSSFIKNKVVSRL
ncbi:MAG: hypothetical protein AB7I27_01340 [Bacteriovoracaceae bacterium]